LSCDRCKLVDPPPQRTNVRLRGRWRMTRNLCGAGRSDMEKRAVFSNKWLGVALVLPQCVLIFNFFYWPTGEALYWAFTLERPWGGGNDWVGLANFSTILGSSIYWASVWKSTVFAFATTGIGMGLALIMALLADRELRGHRIYRTVLVWPYAVAAPALALAFRFILAPQAGFMAIFNHFWPGIWDPVLNGFDAMTAIIIAYVWKSVGYSFIFFLAALQGIPKSLIEAAAMDGSGLLRRIKDIQ